RLESAALNAAAGGYRGRRLPLCRAVRPSSGVMLLDDGIDRSRQLHDLWGRRDGSVSAQHLPPLVSDDLHIRDSPRHNQLFSGSRVARHRGSPGLHPLDPMALAPCRHGLSLGLLSILELWCEALHIDRQLSVSPHELAKNSNGELVL